MEFLRNKHKTIYEYLIITIGVFMLAISIMVLLEPRSLVTGGVSGLGIVIKAVTMSKLNIDIPLWLTNAALNLPLFIIGTKVRGWDFLKRTVYATVLLSVALYFADYIPKLNDIDDLLGAIFGGVISGAGLGLVFRYNATTGGSDLAASIIAKYKPHFQISKIMFLIDALIIAVGFFVFGATKAMYALIAVYISSRLINTVLEGLSFAKAAFIISNYHEQISEKLMNNLDRGVTALHGMGMYTKTNKDIILCVVSTKEIVILKNLVHSVDKSAFVIVTDVREVLGLGFVENNAT